MELASRCKKTERVEPMRGIEPMDGEPKDDDLTKGSVSLPSSQMINTPYINHINERGSLAQCKVCAKHFSTLHEIRMSKEKGCQRCSVKYLGVSQQLGCRAGWASEEWILVSPGESYLIVKILDEKHRSRKPDINQFLIGFCTLAGEPPCPLPMVSVRRRRAQ